MNPTSRLSVGVYRTALCLQVYAIQRYVCGHVPYIALVCRSIPYSACPQVYAYTPYSASCTSCCYASVPYSAGLQSRRSMLHLRTAGMHESHIVPELQACGCISYRAMSAGVHRTVLVCRCMPYSALSAGMYHTSRLSVGVYRIVQSYVCRRIPCSACLSAGVCHTVLCLRTCTIHRACL